VRSKELADAIAADPEMVRRVRAGLAGTMDIRPREEMRDAAFFILFGERDATPNSDSVSDSDADSMTTEVEPEPVQPEPATEAPAEDEPLVVEEHSDDAGEPPAAGHSEPESETPDGGRSQTPTAVITATNLDDAERQMARKRMAEKLKQRSVQATTKIGKYSHE
jgi:hypothetical protein